MRAVPIAVATLRRLAREFVAEHRAGERLQEDVALAITEAVSNVVRHAYGEREPGPIHFSATLVGGAFEFVVSDRGHGFRAGHDPGLGQGLKLIASATADFRIEALDPGTNVVMRFLAGD